MINVVSAGHLPRTIVHDASGASTEWTIIVRCIFWILGVFVGTCIGESNVWRFVILLLISIVCIGGYMMQLIMALQHNIHRRTCQVALVSLLLLLLLLLLFVSSLFMRTIVLKSYGMTYIDLKKRHPRSRDAEDEIVIYIP